MSDKAIRRGKVKCRRGSPKFRTSSRRRYADGGLAMDDKVTSLEEEALTIDPLLTLLLLLLLSVDSHSRASGVEAGTPSFQAFCAASHVSSPQFRNFLAVVLPEESSLLPLTLCRRRLGELRLSSLVESSSFDCHQSLSLGAPSSRMFSRKETKHNNSIAM